MRVEVPGPVCHPKIGIAYRMLGAAGFAELIEDFARALRSLKRALVFSQEDERLNRTAQRARGFLGFTKGFIEFKGFFVMLDGGAILAGSIQGVRFGPQRERSRFFPAKPEGDEQARVGKAEGFLRVHTDFLEHQIRELFYDFGAEKCLVARKKPTAKRLCYQAAQFGEELLARISLGRRRH